jgi:hypothetical protein
MFTCHVMLYLMRLCFHSPLHSNAGAQLKVKILPLHPTLCNIHGGVHVEGPDMPNAIDIIDESHVDASKAADSGENVVSTQQIPALSALVDWVVREEAFNGDSGIGPRVSASVSEHRHGLPIVAPELASNLVEATAPAWVDLLPMRLGSSVASSAPQPTGACVPMHSTAQILVWIRLSAQMLNLQTLDSLHQVDHLCLWTIGQGHVSRTIYKRQRSILMAS